jgi:hypothetical protein
MSGVNKNPLHRRSGYRTSDFPANRKKRGADERTRTADLLITSELLYLLSYVGLLRRISISQGVGGVILLYARWA